MTTRERADHFRRVLGHFPTGVVVVTGLDRAGQPAGLAVGSFTSVSLEPPLVAFLPHRDSTSWPRIRESGAFCVNVLSADQEAVSRTFATHGQDKFADLSWRPAGSGSPVLDGILAYIDCEVEAVHEAGDHWIVLGRVRELDVLSTALPLVFFQGGYGRFAAPSLTARESDLLPQLRYADLARPTLERLAGELGVDCVASVVVGEEIVLLARASGAASRSAGAEVGQRIPFRPPLGTAFVAWADAGQQAAWLRQHGGTGPERDRLRQTLADIRGAGFSVARGRAWHEHVLAVLSGAPVHGAASRARLNEFIAALPPDFESPRADQPGGDGAGDVRTLSAPVFGSAGAVDLVLSVTVTESDTSGSASLPARRLLAAAAEVTAALGGQTRGTTAPY